MQGTLFFSSPPYAGQLVLGVYILKNKVFPEENNAIHVIDNIHNPLSYGIQIS